MKLSDVYPEVGGYSSLVLLDKHFAASSYGKDVPSICTKKRRGHSWGLYFSSLMYTYCNKQLTTEPVVSNMCLHFVPIQLLYPDRHPSPSPCKLECWKFSRGGWHMVPHDIKVAFTLERFQRKRIRTYCLFVKKLPFRLFVYTNPTKMQNENGNFKSGCKSMCFENGTTSHLSFS